MTNVFLAIAVCTKDGLAVVPASPSWDFMAHSYSSAAATAVLLLQHDDCLSPCVLPLLSRDPTARS